MHSDEERANGCAMTGSPTTAARGAHHADIDGVRAVLRLPARALCVLMIAGLQMQLALFFGPRLIGLPFWPVIFYGFWAATIGIAVLGARPALARAWPVFVFSAICVGLALLRPLEEVAKNLIVAMATLSCSVVLANAAGASNILRLSALGTAASAVVCLIDIILPTGMGNVLGRAAGFFVNPNDAAAALLLGTAASYAAVPLQWRGYFLMLVGSALSVTLSKSMILAALCILLLVCALCWPLPRIRWFRHACVALILAGWLATALYVNPRFAVAVHLAYQNIDTAIDAFKAAQDDVEHTLASNEFDARSIDSIIEAIGRRAGNEGIFNSVSARGLLMERAWLVYRKYPWTGVGLKLAYALQPHNSFLMFALAVGLVGWLVPLGLIGLSALPMIRTRDLSHIALPLATFVVAMVSHNLLFSQALLLPIAFAIASGRDDASAANAAREASTT
jgi:hypothetical protein